MSATAGNLGGDLVPAEVSPTTTANRNSNSEEKRKAANKIERFIQKHSADTIYGRNESEEDRSNGLRGLRGWFGRHALQKIAIRSREPRKMPLGVLSPTSSFRQCWNVVAIILVLILSWSLPYRLAYTEGWEGIEMMTFDICVDFFFMLDILINSTTAFIDDDQLVFSRREILLRYARTWLVVDLISSLPFDWLIFGTDFDGIALGDDVGADMGAGQQSSIVRVVKMLKLLKLFRLTRLVRYWNKIEAAITLFFSIPFQLLRFFRVLYFIALLAHWNACLQYLASMLGNFEEGSWVVEFGLVEVGGRPLPKGKYVGDRYSFSFLHAFLQIFAISEGVVIPERTLEIWTTLAALLIGVMTQAVLVASLTSLISSLDASGRDYQQSLDMLNQYMRHARLPRVLRAKLRNFYELMYPGGRSFDEDRILGRLSRSLLEEVTCTLCRGVLQALSVATAHTVRVRTVYQRAGKRGAPLSREQTKPRTKVVRPSTTYCITYRTKVPSAKNGTRMKRQKWDPP